MPATVRLRTPPPVLICRKCLKRVDAGRAIKRALKAELTALSRERGGKRARVVTTGCFGICPKRAVTTTSGVALARNEFLLLADEEQVSEAAMQLTAHET
ncbi:MAG: (2Fe-2S) ferredoxin domain-containing protein [Nitrobacter sp.]